MRKTDLPLGWVLAKIGEVVAQENSKMIPGSANSPKDFIGLDDIAPEIGSIIGRQDPSNLTSAGNVAEIGDIMYCRLRPYLNKVAIADQRYLCSGELLILRIPDDVSNLFVTHWLRSQDFVKYAIANSMGDRPRVYWTAIAESEMPLPPSREQVRIVDELERRLSHVDAAAAGLRSALKRVHLARQSVRIAATSGALVEALSSDSLSKLLDEKGIPYERVTGRPGWIITRLGKVARVGSGSTPKRGDKRYWENGTIPWVTSGQVNQEMIHVPAALITQAALDETSVKIWPAGTLLLAMYGEGKTRGKCAELAINSTCNQACAAIYLENDLSDLQPFIKLSLQSRYEENRGLGGGGVQENLNLGLVKEMPLVLPDFEVQAKLVAEAERRLSLIDVAEWTIVANITKTEQLRRSVLAAAFDGQLVSQDPNDEPAERLIESIRERRAKQTTAKTDDEATTRSSTKTRKKEPSK